MGFPPFEKMTVTGSLWLTVTLQTFILVKFNSQIFTVFAIDIKMQIVFDEATTHFRIFLINDLSP